MVQSISKNITQESINLDWSSKVYELIKIKNIKLIASVPDGGLTKLLNLLEADKDITVVTLATEEEGIALLAGGWIGGVRGLMLMQSSGVGNTINMLSLPIQCRIPFLTLVTMRGQWGEFNPWQITMGQAVPKVFEAMGLTVYPVEKEEDVDKTFSATADYVFNTGKSAAILVGQRIIGAKSFEEN